MRDQGGEARQGGGEDKGEILAVRTSEDTGASEGAGVDAGVGVTWAAAVGQKPRTAPVEMSQEDRLLAPRSLLSMLTREARRCPRFPTQG